MNTDTIDMPSASKEVFRIIGAELNIEPTAMCEEKKWFEAYEEQKWFEGKGTCGNIDVRITLGFQMPEAPYGFMFIENSVVEGMDTHPTDFVGCPIVRWPVGGDVQAFARNLIIPFRKGLYELDKSGLSESTQQDIMKMMG